MSDNNFYWRPMLVLHAEDGDEVLLWDGRTRAVGEYDAAAMRWKTYDKDFGNPTHWMPLPEPPPEQ